MPLKDKISLGLLSLVLSAALGTCAYSKAHPGPTAAQQLYVAQTASVRAVQRLYGQQVTSVYCHAPANSEDRCNKAFNDNGAYCHPRWPWMQRDTLFCCDTRAGANNGGCYIAP